jgi:hypothetical protein
MVIEPMFHRHDNGEDDSSDDEEEPDDSQRVIILHPVGSLSTFSENSLHIRGLTTYPPEKFQPPIALSVCQESRKFTLRHYHHLHHQGFPSHDFYIHPKRDILWLSENRVHDHLPTLRHSYGDLITRCTNILVDRFSWDDEKLRDDTLRSLKLLSAIECILILDDTVRLVEEDDGTYLVPDRDKIIARANRYRTEYEHFVKSLEKQNEVEGKDIRCGNPRRVLCVDRDGDLY